MAEFIKAEDIKVIRIPTVYKGPEDRIYSYEKVSAAYHPSLNPEDRKIIFNIEPGESLSNLAGLTGELLGDQSFIKPLSEESCNYLRDYEGRSSQLKERAIFLGDLRNFRGENEISAQVVCFPSYDYAYNLQRSIIDHVNRPELPYEFLELFESLTEGLERASTQIYGIASGDKEKSTLGTEFRSLSRRMGNLMAFSFTNFPDLKYLDSLLLKSTHLHESSHALQHLRHPLDYAQAVVSLDILDSMENHQVVLDENYLKAFNKTHRAVIYQEAVSYLSQMLYIPKIFGEEFVNLQLYEIFSPLLLAFRRGSQTESLSPFETVLQNASSEKFRIEPHLFALMVLVTERPNLLQDLEAAPDREEFIYTLAKQIQAGFEELLTNKKQFITRLTSHSFVACIDGQLGVLAKEANNFARQVRFNKLESVELAGEDEENDSQNDSINGEWDKSIFLDEGK